MNKKVLILGAVLTVALAATASAAGADITVEPGTSGNGYKITCDMVSSSGQYVLLIVEAGADIKNLSVNTDILYIDQAEAGSEGTVVFDNLLLKENKNADIYIGGEGFSSPVSSLYNADTNLGGIYVEGTPGSGNVIYYKVASAKTPSTATVSLYDADHQLIASTETDKNGDFVLEIPSGEQYQLVVTKPGYLTYTIPNITSTTALSPIDIRGGAGDIADRKGSIGSGAINSTDLGYLIADYLKTNPYYDSDLDNSGAVNSTDLSALIANYGKSINR